MIVSIRLEHDLIHCCLLDKIQPNDEGEIPEDPDLIDALNGQEKDYLRGPLTVADQQCVTCSIIY